MRTVKKLKLNIDAPVTYSLPRQHWLVCAIEEADGLYLWMRFDDEDKVEVKKTYHVVGAGTRMPIADCLYVETIKAKPVYHVFEEAV